MMEGASIKPVLAATTVAVTDRNPVKVSSTSGQANASQIPIVDRPSGYQRSSVSGSSSYGTSQTNFQGVVGEKGILEKDAQVLVHPEWYLPEQKSGKVWIKAKDLEMIDADGVSHLDFLSGLYCSFIGHGREEMAQAAYDQIRTLDFVSSFNGFSNVPSIELSTKVLGIMNSVGWSHLKSIFFASGGSEANEVAFHAALHYWLVKGRPAKCRFISFQSAYHGTTLMASSASNDSVVNYSWEKITKRMTGLDVLPIFEWVPVPLPVGFDMTLCKPGETPSDACIRILEQRIIEQGSEHFAALIAESLMGDAGAIAFPDDFLPRVRQVLARYDILLILDEVLVGFGRTGKWFGAQQYPLVQPDMVTFAKQITSGYCPLGGCAMSDDIITVLSNADAGNKFLHGYTYSCHPVACALALKNIQIIERENLVVRAHEIGGHLLRRLKEELSGLSSVVDIRGRGLLIAIQFSGAYASEVQLELRDKHRIIVGTNKHSTCLHLTPPAIVTMAQCDIAVMAIKEAIQKSCGTMHQLGSKMKQGLQTLVDKAALGIAAMSTQETKKF